MKFYEQIDGGQARKYCGFQNCVVFASTRCWKGNSSSNAPTTVANQQVATTGTFATATGAVTASGKQSVVNTGSQPTLTTGTIKAATGSTVSTTTTINNTSDDEAIAEDAINANTSIAGNIESLFSQAITAFTTPAAPPAQLATQPPNPASVSTSPAGGGTVSDETASSGASSFSQEDWLILGFGAVALFGIIWFARK